MRKVEFESAIVETLSRLVRTNPPEKSIAVDASIQATVDFLVDMAVADIATRLGIPVPFRPDRDDGQGGMYRIVYGDRVYEPEWRDVVWVIQRVVGGMELTAEEDHIHKSVRVWGPLEAPAGGRRLVARMKITLTPWDTLISFEYVGGTGAFED